MLRTYTQADRHTIFKKLKKLFSHASKDSRKEQCAAPWTTNSGPDRPSNTVSVKLKYQYSGWLCCASLSYLVSLGSCSAARTYAPCLLFSPIGGDLLACLNLAVHFSCCFAKTDNRDSGWGRATLYSIRRYVLFLLQLFAAFEAPAVNFRKRDDTILRPCMHSDLIFFHLTVRLSKVLSLFFGKSEIFSSTAQCVRVQSKHASVRTSRFTIQ